MQCVLSRTRRLPTLKPPTHVAETVQAVLRQLLCEHVATQRQIGCDSLDSHVLLHAATTAQAAATCVLTRCAHIRSYAETEPRSTGLEGPNTAPKCYAPSPSGTG